MRILNVTAQKPDSTGSGVYLSELITSFNKLGHSNAVIYGITESDIVNMDSNVIKYPVIYKSKDLPYPILGMSDEMPYESTRYRDLTKEMTEQFKEVFRRTILKALDEFKPDIILCHHLYLLTALVKELAKDIPVFSVCHGTCLRQLKKNEKNREYIIENIKKLDGIFALHEEQKMEISEYFNIPLGKISVIGTGYNNRVFNIDESIKDKHDDFRLIFAGKVSHKKGVMSLIKSLEYLPDFPFTLEIAGGAGNVEEYNEIVNLAKKSSKNIIFSGKLDQLTLKEHLNRSDAFILPSFFEGLPLVIIEAMACGLPVVCTNLPGIKPWIEKNNLIDSVIFIEPPLLKNQDEPEPSTLFRFEKDLAEGILKVKEINCPNQEEVIKISWMGLAKRILDILDKKYEIK